jgi:hypothetical protein
MLTEFIDTQLAQIDTLDELKVILTVLRILERKQLPSASVTEVELLQHPAIRDGLRFPSITLKPALQLAVARGVLLEAIVASEPARYFFNTPDAARVIAALATAQPDKQPVDVIGDVFLRVRRKIERLESIDAYRAAPDDQTRLAYWLALGYSSDEILAAIQSALLHPRAGGTPHRTLYHCEATLFAHPPALPSDYHAVYVARTRKPSEEVINLRLRLGRDPQPDEYAIVRAAAGQFGARATMEGLRSIFQAPQPDLTQLLPLLSEAESTALERAGQDLAHDEKTRAAVQLYEQTFGALPTSTIALEIQQLAQEVPDMQLWRGVFEYAVRQNKKSWPYVRKLLRNPSADLFAPPPVNDTAKAAFELYRRRINRILDASVATDINVVAEKVTDLATWTAAFDKAAAANAMRWDYIKSVLTSARDPKPGRDARINDNGKRQPARQTGRPGGSFRRPQVQYTDEERRAAEERARRELEAEANDGSDD